MIDAVEARAAKADAVEPLKFLIRGVVIDLGDAAEAVADFNQRIMNDAVIGAVGIGRHQHGALDPGNRDHRQVML
jgi:hypothetical protein